MKWAERLDVDVEALMVLQRHDAEDEGAADVVRGARAVYLVGDSSMHLRSALKDTPVLAALGDVLAAGGLVAAVGPSAAALCDPMLDQRGGAFTLGLGLVRGRRRRSRRPRTWSEERRQRTLSLADTPVVELPTGSALLRGRRRLGAGRRRPIVHGELPCDGQDSVISTRLDDDLLASACRPSAGARARIAWATSRPSVIVAEHDVGALGVEVRRRRARSVKNHCAPAEFGRAGVRHRDLARRVRVPDALVGDRVAELVGRSSCRRPG